GERPNSLREIQLFPLQTCNLLPALAGERQKFNNASVRSTDLPSGEDDLAELLVIQHPVASDLPRGQRHALSGRLVKDGSTHAPPQERLDRLQGLVGGGRCPALLDRRDHLNHISLSDLMNAPAGPRLSHLPTKQPGNLGDGAVL